jgi:hypothetical protein
MLTRRPRRLSYSLSVGAALAVVTLLFQFVGAVSPAEAAGQVVTVNFAISGGTPSDMASGFIYGIAQDGSQPPNSTLTTIKTKFLRAGGAQIGCPNGGWINGQYTPRWNSVLAYYTKAVAIGAVLELLPHDLWGADAVCTVPRWPGQGGDWTEYTNFMTQVINDVKASGMTGSNVRWDLWNEPDGAAFWGGTQAQYFEMWKRGFQQVRAAIPNAVIEGPSLANQPNNGWWNAYLDYIKANNVIPDYLSWHDEGGGNDPVTDANNLRSALSARGISVTGFDDNEYGTASEQGPGHSAWYIARLERAGASGLRGNWGMAGGLYLGMGDLVTSSWQPLGQYWMYRRYADQTGLRTSVTPSSDNQIDATAFQDSAAAKSIIVVGNKGGTGGAITVQLNNIPSWLQNHATTQVLIERMPAGTTAVSAPTVVSNLSTAVSGNALSVPINWTNPLDGYVITLTRGTGPGQGPPVYPPNVDFGMTGVPAILPSGQSVIVSESFTNNARVAVSPVTLTLIVPSGWTATPTTATTFPAVPHGKTVTASWRVTAPATPQIPMAAELTGTASYAWDTGSAQATSTADVHVTSPIQPPYLTFASTSAYFGQAGSQFGIYGDGGDVWVSTNQYGAIYLHGAEQDGTVAEVKVTAQQPTDPWAKAGIMIRNDITESSGSPGFLIVAVTPGNGYVVQWDSNGDGTLDSYVSSSTGPMATYPSWLKVVRSGTSYTGYYSTDGTNWILIATVNVPNAAATQDVGMFMTSHASGSLGEADFANFSVQ